jgi:predicted glycogen debranching enzyme
LKILFTSNHSVIDPPPILHASKYYPNIMTAHFDHHICKNPDQSLPREWLETNGIGGYASSSMLGCNTRKYHGLLVASLPQFHNKFVLLSKMEPSIVIGEEEIEFSTNHYPGALHPRGYEHLESFESNPCPTWTFSAKGTTLRQSFCMVQGKDAVVFKFEVLKSEQAKTRIRLKPFLAYRVNHELTRQNRFINGELRQSKSGFSLNPYDNMPALHLHFSHPFHISKYGHWFQNFEYYRERERGFDHHEDLFCPAQIEVELKVGEVYYVSAGLNSELTSPETHFKSEMARREKLLSEAQASGIGLPELHCQGEQFLTRNSRGELSITAGFPWFVEWGRDTMIALPGLTITRGHPELGFEILKSYAKHEKNGLIPNYLAIGDGHHAYNSIDASLWFFWAIGELLKCEGFRQKIIAELLPTMENIIRTYMEGRVPHAKVREDGLISAGNPGTQLTWMDANAYGRPATSRHGCPVEINALFIHAIYLYKDLAKEAGRQLPKLDELDKRIRKAFVQKFWLSKKGYLADVVREEADGAIRPNQIFAVSLSSCPLSLEQRRSVVETVRRELLTPYGLRTLEKAHPYFRARYEGNGDERDSAYHQGTVWPWLLGHFMEASLLTAANPKEEALRLESELQPLVSDHLWQYGMGSIAEIYDATDPQRPAGTIAQAWSVSEVLRGFALIKKAKGN